MTREEAINAITAFVENYACGSDLDGLREAIEALKEQRPHGEWVESKERKGHFYCSECVQQDESGKWRELFDYKYNFCPNCGADMREGGEKE